MMADPGLLNHVKVDKVINSVSAGTATNSSDILDMQGFEGVMFVASMGDVSNTSVITLQVQQNTSNSASGMATLDDATTSFTADASTADDKLLIVDCVKPLKRYVRCQLITATANGEIDSVIAIRYGAHAKPITQGSDVVASDIGVSPAEA